MISHLEPRRSNAWIAGHDPLTVVALGDPVIDKLGHTVGSAYVETYWLPILGPSAIWAARRLVYWLDDHDSVDIPLDALGRSLGLGGGVANNSPVVRTLARLVDFGMAATGGSAYAIRRRFPPLPTRLVDRLPSYLAESRGLRRDPCFCRRPGGSAPLDPRRGA
jgi:hypothetical protein